MENTNLTEKATIVPVVKEIRSILDTARSNVARQVNNELRTMLTEPKKEYWMMVAMVV